MVGEMKIDGESLLNGFPFSRESLEPEESQKSKGTEVGDKTEQGDG